MAVSKLRYINTQIYVYIYIYCADCSDTVNEALSVGVEFEERHMIFNKMIKCAVK